MRLYGQTCKSDQVHPEQAAKYEDDAGRYWDLFYKRNSDKFFKDRHYFDKEWPQLTQGEITVLEVGCGAGNSVFPLLEINPQSYVYACDFSPRAVELVQAHPAYAETGRVTAFVADITQHEGPGALSQQLPGPCADFCSMVFVLSAVAPHRMRQALQNVASVLKAGTGRVLFRDYADGDLAQTRLQDSQAVKHIRGNFYARGDGTCCYYFTQNELSALFAAEGFVCESSLIHARVIENRKSGVKMPRRWIQAVFRYDPAVQPPQPIQQLDQSLQQQQRSLPQKQPHQQQQQQQFPADSFQEAVPVNQECNGLGAISSSSSSVDCAGQTWVLPSWAVAGHGSSTSSSEHLRCGDCSCICLAAALADLVQGQQLQLLGRGFYIAPPWLCIQQQQQRKQDGAGSCADSSVVQQQQQQIGVCTPRQECHLQVHSQQGALVPRARCVAAATGSSSSSSGPEAVQQAGAAAGLLALVAVWLGARCVWVCLPDSSLAQSTLADPQQQQQQQLGSSQASAQRAGLYAEAFEAVLALNECRVVVERIRPKRWQQGDLRRAATLQRELLAALERGPPACTGMVLLAMGAAGSASSSSAGSGSAEGIQDDQGAQKLVEALYNGSQAMLCSPVQLLLSQTS